MWFVKELTSLFAEHFFVILTQTDKTYENDTFGLEFFWGVCSAQYASWVPK